LTELKKDRPWYKNWWIWLIILFLLPFILMISPLFLLLSWRKKNWPKWIKISLSSIAGVWGLFLVITIIGTMAENKKNVQEAQVYFEKANTYVASKDLVQAKVALGESIKLNPSKTTNGSHALLESINTISADSYVKDILMKMSEEDFELLKAGKLETVFNDNEDLNAIIHDNLLESVPMREKHYNDLVQSEEYITTTLMNMSDSDFELLKKKELKTEYFINDELNNLLLQNLHSNLSIREIAKEKERLAQEALAKQEEEKRLAEEEAKRTALIEKQFSAWDGSHRNLTSLIKESMNDPKSYEHVETVYWDMKDHLVVRTTFRGKNAFGGVVKQSVKAKVTLDGEVFEIME
jgi:hypothetical protein